MFSLSILFFILGVSIGSFLNVIIDRVPREETFIYGRSHCDFCKHPLMWYDLVPLLSFALLQGKCRYCKRFIGIKYPIVELSTGILFVIASFPVLTNWSFLIILQTLFTLLVFSSCVVIFYTDLWSGIIPDVILFPITAITFFYLFIHPQDIIMHLLSALGGCVFFLALFLITRGRGMGFGDVKLAFFLGLLLGWPGVFLAIYIAFLTGAVAALILIVWGKKRFFGGIIPFGPFLIIGTLVSWFWAPLLWQKILEIL